MSEAFLVGRDPGNVTAPFQGTDLLFAGLRLDGSRVKSAQYSHCTFANVSFKEAELEDSTFVDCAFLSCYFRRGILRNSSFTGCKFIDCDFPRVSVHSCEFKYSSFRGCFLSYGEMKESLPSEANLREALADNLSREAEGLGSTKDARLYRLNAIDSRKSHLTAGFKHSSSWHEDHFPGFKRVEAFLSVLWISINGFLWGHGERARVLVRNFVALVAVVYPLIYYGLRQELLSQVKIGAKDFLLLSLDQAFGASSVSPTELAGTTVKLVAVSESVVAIIFFGLFVTMLLRWITSK